MTNDSAGRLRKYRALMAPGTPLRHGLDRILRGRTGALIVLGSNKAVEEVTTGGFEINTPFTPTGLRELAKMDGAIILNNECDQILMAGVHLVPDAHIDTIETGTRHRTADRVARQTGCPAVTVSASMSTIGLFLGSDRHVIEDSSAILGRANLALQTLERYKTRLIEVTARLSTLEVHDQVTVKDLVLVAQRLEMVRRLGFETGGYVTDLGTDGRLMQLQLLEVRVGVEELPELLELDYAHDNTDRLDFEVLTELSDEELVEPHLVARALGFTDPLDSRVYPLGYRQLSHVNRLPAAVAGRLVEHFGSLQALFGATTSELLEVEGVGESRARLIRDGLTRLAESAFTESVD